MSKLDKMIQTSIVIGDWSNDGHGKSEEFYYMVNYSLSDIRKAYKNSCEKTKVFFHDNQDTYNRVKNDEITCEFCKYEQSVMSEKAFQTLKHYGLLDYADCEEQAVETEEDLANLIMNFIALSMPKDFVFVICKRPEPINGYWNKELNEQFGYGLYY